MKKTCKRLVIKGVMRILHSHRSTNTFYDITTDIFCSYICVAGKSDHRKCCSVQITTPFNGLAGFFTSGLFPTPKNLHTMDNLPRVTTFVKWRQIDGFPDYSVSNTGLAKFKHTIMTLQLRTGRKDYYYIIVRNTTAKKFARLDVHRLVWDYFGSEPFKKGYEVHHKDENPNNNHIDNLELLLLAVHRKLHAKSHCKGYKKQIL